MMSLPDADNRYYLFSMLDGWIKVFQVTGKRTTGTGPQKYAITGPGWKGELPEGIKEYKSPTSIVWVLGRIYCTGKPEDYAQVHTMQDETSIVPLSTYGTPYTPLAGKVDPGIDLNRRSRAGERSRHRCLLQSADRVDEGQSRSGGGRSDDREDGEAWPQARCIFRLLNARSLPVQVALKNVPTVGFGRIMGHFKGAGEDINGWVFTTKTGLYGTDYLQRALVTAIGLGVDRPQDAVYPTSEVDAEGRPYTGANRYVMHFPKGQFQPVNGFWSLTMYNADYFFVENPLNRYTLIARNDLRKNADGSVDLYLQHANSGPEKESNWLPAPAGRFILMLRLYWPTEKSSLILNGTWKIPAVEKVQ